MMDSMKMKMDEMTSTQMIDMLKEKSGDEFDQMFLEHMSMHHQMGIDMAQIAASKASHAEIRNLSEKMIKDQTEEMEKMNQWHKDWYGDK